MLRSVYTLLLYFSFCRRLIDITVISVNMFHLHFVYLDLDINEYEGRFGVRGGPTVVNSVQRRRAVASHAIFEATGPVLMAAAWPGRN